MKKIHANSSLHISVCGNQAIKNTRIILWSIWKGCWEYQQMLKIPKNTKHMQIEYSHKTKNAKIFMHLHVYCICRNIQVFFRYSCQHLLPNSQDFIGFVPLYIYIYIICMGILCLYMCTEDWPHWSYICRSNGFTKLFPYIIQYKGLTYLRLSN